MRHEEERYGFLFHLTPGKKDRILGVRCFCFHLAERKNNLVSGFRFFSLFDLRMKKTARIAVSLFSPSGLGKKCSGLGLYSSFF